MPVAYGPAMTGASRCYAAVSSFDDDLRLLGRDFAVQQFVTELRIEALAIAVFPRAARHDVGGPGCRQSWLDAPQQMLISDVLPLSLKPAVWPF